MVEALVVVVLVEILVTLAIEEPGEAHTDLLVGQPRHCAPAGCST
jgi:hypothetical protein